MGWPVDDGLGSAAPTQLGNQVQGQYFWPNTDGFRGEIRGEVQGNHLVGNWLESGQKGPIDLTLSEDGQSFEGLTSGGISGSRWDKRRGTRVATLLEVNPAANLAGQPLPGSPPLESNKPEPPSMMHGIMGGGGADDAGAPGGMGAGSALPGKMGSGGPTMPGGARWNGGGVSGCDARHDGQLMAQSRGCLHACGQDG